MKTMKWIATFCMIVGITVAAQAQQVEKINVESKAKLLQMQLDLSDEQTKKVASIYRDIQNENASDEAMQDSIKSWRAAHNMQALSGYILKQMKMMRVMTAKIDSLLTDEQKTKYETQLAATRAMLQKMARQQ